MICRQGACIADAIETPQRITTTWVELRRQGACIADKGRKYSGSRKSPAVRVFVDILVVTHWFAETSGFFVSFCRGGGGKRSVRMGLSRSKSQNKAPEASAPRSERCLVRVLSRPGERLGDLPDHGGEQAGVAGTRSL